MAGRYGIYGTSFKSSVGKQTGGHGVLEAGIGAEPHLGYDPEIYELTEAS